MNKFKSTEKDKAFEELIKELQPITRKSIRRDFRVAETSSGIMRHILKFNYLEFECTVELK